MDWSGVQSCCRVSRFIRVISRVLEVLETMVPCTRVSFPCESGGGEKTVLKRLHHYGSVPRVLIRCRRVRRGRPLRFSESQHLLPCFLNTRCALVDSQGGGVWVENVSGEEDGMFPCHDSTYHQHSLLNARPKVTYILT